MLPVAYLTIKDLALAGASGTIFTTIGQLNIVTQIRLEHVFVGVNLKLFAARFDGDLVRHSHSFNKSLRCQLCNRLVNLEF